MMMMMNLSPFESMFSIQLAYNNQPMKFFWNFHGKYRCDVTSSSFFFYMSYTGNCNRPKAIFFCIGANFKVSVEIWKNIIILWCINEESIAHTHNSSIYSLKVNHSPQEKLKSLYLIRLSRVKKYKHTH